MDAGADYTVPSDTSFVLKGIATDANNDLPSFTWEQKDKGVPKDAEALGQTNGIGGYSAVVSKKHLYFTPNNHFNIK